MKETKYFRNKRQLKNSTTVFSMLIVAVLILSSVASVSSSEQSTTINSITPEQNLWGESEGPQIIDSITTDVVISEPTRYDVLWDNGLWLAGLASAQEEDVYDLDSVPADDFMFDDDTEVFGIFFIGGYWNPPGEGEFSWNISFYDDDGTGYYPGAVIYNQVFDHDDIMVEHWYDTATSWYNNYTIWLPTEVFFENDTRYWISIQGVGDFPPQSGLGRFNETHGPVKLSEAVWKSPFFGYPTWTNSTIVWGDPYAFDFQLLDENPNDLAMVSIDAPTYGEAGIITPQVTIDNLGTSTPTDVPVNMKISTIGASTILLTEDFEGFVPPSIVFPPTGWAVFNEDGGTYTWQHYTTGQRTGTGCAYCHYDSTTYAPNNDWLTTKGTTVATGGVFSVWIDGYSYSDDSFEIWMSTTGNTVSDFLSGGTQLANITVSPTVYTLYSYDMSTYIGQTVYFAIRYTGDYAWYIWVDDITFPDGTTEGFEPLPATGFPPAGWLLYDWDGTGAEFTANDDSLYAPPNSVGYFAYVKDTSISSISETLLSPSVDMTGVSTGRIQFDHKFDFWGPGDYVAIEIWSGGSYVEEIAQWTADADEHADIIFDPSIYSDVSDIQIGFYYYDGATYAEEWAIDNVEISAVPIMIEYDETVYVDITNNRFGKSQIVEFPAWIPDDWQVTSNEIIDYQVEASVNLDEDVNPDNNGIGPITVSLIYPFTMDLGVTEINTPPGDAPPAQTLPVEITVENEGQFQAAGFTAQVEISAIGSEPGFFDFETSDGGFVPSADWDPVGDWEYTDSYDVNLYVPGPYNNYPPPTAYSGDGLWGTKLYSPYTNSGGTSFLKKTVDFSGVTDAYISFYSWCDLFGTWDYGTITVDGTQVFYIDDIVPTSWNFFTVDLSAYDGQEVEISFNIYATTVVEYTGWYIDDIEYPSAGGGGGCEYEVVLYDSYGDGWNGGVMDVIVDGTTVLDDITIVSGAGPEIYAFSVFDGSTILLDYTAGSWPGENYFDLFDSEGTLIVDDWYPYYDGDWTGTASCPGGGGGGVLEYSETVVVTDPIDPDETIIVEFPDWTPARLLTGESGVQNYEVNATIQYNPDLNYVNDGKLSNFGLEYFHDIEITDVTQPMLDRGVILEESFEDAWVPDSSGDLAPPDWETHVTNAGGSDPFWFHWMRVGEVVYGGTDPVPAPDGDYQCICHWDYYDQDEWLCSPEISLGDDSELTFMFYGHFGSTYGDHYYVKVSPSGGYQPADFTDTVWDASTEPAGDNHYDFPVVVDLSAYDGQTIRIAWNDYAIGGLWYSNIIDQISVESGGGGAPGGDIFVQPGTYDIEALISNNGVFVEPDVDMYADLFEFNETGFPQLIYEANITDVELDPAESYTADFGSYDFNVEQIYRLDIEAAVAVDDDLDNNMVSLGIAVDGTAPISDATVNPPVPSTGWYTGDVTVTITANDGSEDWQSGVADIKYKIDGGAEMTYTAPFVISADGEHTVTYWAVDNVGNKEADNTIDVDIDTTGPTIDLTWEAGSGMNEVIFTATCSDTLSGMDIVEFYVNDVLQFTADTAPYTWTMVHGAGTKYTVKAIAYDAAGNTDFDEIGSGEGLNVNVYTTPTPLIK